MMLRRRVMDSKSVDPYAAYVKMKTRNSSQSGNYNILGQMYHMGYDVSTWVEQMLVDGVEITPTRSYTFDDSNYHDVYILFKDITKLDESAFQLGNYSVKFIDIPESFVTFGVSAIRALGGSQRVDILIRSTTYPTFGTNNNLGHIKGHLWIPDNLYDDYIASPVGFSAANIHKLSDWTG